MNFKKNLIFNLFLIFILSIIAGSFIYLGIDGASSQYLFLASYFMIALLFWIKTRNNLLILILIVSILYAMDNYLQKGPIFVDWIIFLLPHILIASIYSLKISVSSLKKLALIIALTITSVIFSLTVAILAHLIPGSKALDTVKNKVCMPALARLHEQVQHTHVNPTTTEEWEICIKNVRAGKNPVEGLE